MTARKHLWCVHTPEGHYIACESAALAAGLCRDINAEAADSPERSPTSYVAEWPGTPEDHDLELDPWLGTEDDSVLARYYELLYGRRDKGVA